MIKIVPLLSLTLWKEKVPRNHVMAAEFAGLECKTTANPVPEHTREQRHGVY